MPEIELNPPSERSCRLCNRREVWDPERGEWRIATDDGERSVGKPFCIHEWDITGTHKPILETG